MKNNIIDERYGAFFYVFRLSLLTFFTEKLHGPRPASLGMSRIAEWGFASLTR